MSQSVVGYLGFLLRDRETRPGKLTNALLYLLNTVFVGLYIVSTYDLPPPYSTSVTVGELGLGVVFLVEYVVRVASADDRWAEFTNPFTIIDIVAVFPVFLGLGVDIGFLRGLHALRVFRFLRLLVKEQQILGRSLRVRTIRQIELSVTIFLIFFISTGFVYAAERDANAAISNFGDAFYYAVISISTVGFGDIVPVTAAGRWITVMAVLVGFVLIPWQATRLRSVSGRADETCSRCGAGVAVTDRYCRQCGFTLTGDSGVSGESETGSSD